MKSILQVVIIAILTFNYGCTTKEQSTVAPQPTCSDQIQNQGELGVDCGGPCNACPGKMTAKVDGVAWVSGGNVTSSTNNNSIIILAGNGTSTISLIYTGSFVPGTFPLNSAIYSETLTQTNYLATSGSITFSSWNEQNEVVSGSFSFTGIESSGTGQTKSITDGHFEFVPYHP